MIDWERAEQQVEQILALDARQRLFALLTLRYDHPDALDEAVKRAEEWGRERRCGGRS